MTTIRPPEEPLPLRPEVVLWRWVARALGPVLAGLGEPVEQDTAGGHGVLGGRALPGRHTRQ